MKKFSYDYFYLGFALTFFANLSLLNWRLYAIIIPFTILQAIRTFKK